jgi:hypothetical protein
MVDLVGRFGSCPQSQQRDNGGATIITTDSDGVGQQADRSVSR